MSGGLKEQQAPAALQKSEECSEKVNSGIVQDHPAGWRGGTQPGMTSEKLGRISVGTGESKDPEKARKAVPLQPGLPGCGGDGTGSGKWRGENRKVCFEV